MTEQSDCSGVWLGADTTCDATPPCGPMGGCCSATGTCSTLPEEVCNGYGDYFLGPAAPCSLTACWASDGRQSPHSDGNGFAASSCLHWRYSNWHELFWNQPYDPSLPGLPANWSQDPITAGACCRPSTGHCVNAPDYTQCNDEFHLGVMCESLVPPCGSGACCYEQPLESGNWYCAADVSEVDCAIVQGAFYPGLGCADIPCPPWLDVPAKPTPPQVADAPQPIGGRGWMGTRVADDWQYDGNCDPCDPCPRVTHIRWWGKQISGTPDRFYIRLHDHFAPSCVPDQWPSAIWDIYAHPNDIQTTSVWGGITQYDYDLPEYDWFYPHEELGSRYWIDIAARYDTIYPGEWRWSLSAQQPNQDPWPDAAPWYCPTAVAEYPPAEPYWHRLVFDPSGDVCQMAFALGTNESNVPHVNTVVADNFILSYPPIMGLRWWGSYLDPIFRPEVATYPYEVDGWFISFHHALPDSDCPPAWPGDSPTVLGLYFVRADTAEITNLGQTDCNGLDVYEYVAGLNSCTLLCAFADPRTGQIPAERRKFSGTPGLKYWVAIQAVAGVTWVAGTQHTLDEGWATDRLPSPNVPGGHFWGRRSASLSLFGPACAGQIHDPLELEPCVEYGNWTSLSWGCPGTPPDEIDVSLETLVLMRGACCDWSTYTCTDHTLFTECQAAEMQWTPDALCSDLEPRCAPPGACCAANGDCEDLDELRCLTSGRTWWGPETACDGFTCPQPGACCFPDGHCEMSTVIDPGDCAPGGVYQGDGTECSPNVCPQPDVACCFANGDCTMLTATACTTAGGSPGEYGSTCTPNECPQPGACCLLDGTCTLTIEAACSGIWQGAQTTCDPNPCSPAEACCLADGSCLTLPPVDCVIVSGVSKGPFTYCFGTGSDGPCAAKWIQVPDLSPNGLDVTAAVSLILADDFLCTERSAITDIAIWGAWYGDFLPGDPRDVQFTLSIHADIPAGAGYSTPGDVLWSQVFPPSSFDAAEFQSGLQQGWYDPPSGSFEPVAAAVCWKYSFHIPRASAFCQMGTPSQPLVYWLDVQTETDNDSFFGWKTSLRHWNDGAVWGLGAEPYLGPWSELRYPAGHPYFPESIDLAFVVGSQSLCECIGDMNCDGFVNLVDINPFTLYMSNPSAWQSQYPGCPLSHGDINGDGTYPSFGDINPLVALLMNPRPCQ